MASTEELNAGFDALEGDIHQLIEAFVPGMFKGQARNYLNSQQGRDLILDGVRKVLKAAEDVRARG